MRLAPMLWLVLALLVSPGCLVLSVHPAYSEAPVPIDNRLLGRWQDAETGNIASISAGEWKSYRVTLTDRTGSMALTGFETTIGSARLLDLTLEGGLEKSLMLLPLHAIGRMSLDGDALTITPIDYDRFVASAKGAGTGRIQYTIDERKNVVLSSDTAGLRVWLQQHLGTPGFFGPPVVFTRMVGE